MVTKPIGQHIFDEVNTRQFALIFSSVIFPMYGLYFSDLLAICFPIRTLFISVIWMVVFSSVYQLVFSNFDNCA